MHNRPERLCAAIGCNRTRRGRYGLVVAKTFLVVAISFALVGVAMAEMMSMPPAEMPAAGDPGAPPMSQSGDVSFFSQDLGTILRLRDSTESYGQDKQGNFDIGSMQVITMEDSTAFLDGQVTANDNNGVGFNVGAGYRWIDTPGYAMNAARMEGVSLWADGTQHGGRQFLSAGRRLA